MLVFTEGRVHISSALSSLLPSENIHDKASFLTHNLEQFIPSIKVSVTHHKNQALEVYGDWDTLKIVEAILNCWVPLRDEKNLADVAKMSTFKSGAVKSVANSNISNSANVNSALSMDNATQLAVKSSDLIETIALQPNDITPTKQVIVSPDTELRRSCRSIKKSWKMADESPYQTESVTANVSLKNAKSPIKDTVDTVSEHIVTVKKEPNTDTFANTVQLDKPYKCHNCKYATNIAANLKQHVIRMHSQVFTCSVCNEDFYAKRDLVLHSFLHTKPHACTLCDKRYSTKQFLNRHRYTAHSNSVHENSAMREHGDLMIAVDAQTPMNADSKKSLHNESGGDSVGVENEKTCFDEFPFKCDECDYKTTSQINLSQHLQRMHKERLHKCEKCSKSFGLAKDLAEHIRWHDKPHECTVCSQHFAKGYLLDAHVVKEHPDCKAPTRKRRRLPTPRQPVYACPQCTYITHVARYLRNHVTRNHCERTHTCTTCGKSFALPKDLKQHETFHVRQTHICHICNKTLHSKFALRLHISAVHNGVRATLREYLCTLCGKLCRNLTAYREHQNREHLKVRPFVCSICNAAFHGKGTLKVHMIRHQSERRHKCETCSKGFKSRAGLCAHQVVHQQTRPFHCDTCNKGFTQKAALIRHQRIHTGERPFKCALCTASFNDNSILRRHLIGIHKIASGKYAANWSSEEPYDDDGVARRGRTPVVASSADVKPVVASNDVPSVDTAHFTLAPVSAAKSQLLETALLECGDDADNAWLKYKNVNSSSACVDIITQSVVSHDKAQTQTNLHQLIEAVKMATPDGMAFVKPESQTEPIVCASEVVVQAEGGTGIGEWPAAPGSLVQLKEVELVGSKQIGSNQWLVEDQCALSGDCSTEQVMYSLDDQRTLYIVTSSSSGEQTNLNL